MKATDAVLRLIRQLFPPSEIAEVVNALAHTELPLINNNAERVFLAVLLLSGGDMQKFRQELELATIDWGDTLVAAGMADENWPEVVRAAERQIPET